MQLTLFKTSPGKPQSCTAAAAPFYSTQAKLASMDPRRIPRPAPFNLSVLPAVFPAASNYGARPTPAAPPRVPQHALPRGVKSVAAVLYLWVLGGRTAYIVPVAELERMYGTSWQLEGDKAYYSTMKKIMDKVRRKAAIECITEEEVIVLMDQRRGNVSLEKVCKVIRDTGRY
jgi:hypothetical protein